MKRILIVKVLILVSTIIYSQRALSHDTNMTSARYLGNAGILISEHNSKLLFDPFFHKDFSIYQLVPEETRQAIFQGVTPYNDVNFVFISHAHDDHFSASDLLKYVNLHQKVQIIAPQQAIDKLTRLSDFKQTAKHVLPRLHAVTLSYGDMAWSKTINNVQVSAVRIPHAGWPNRAEVENIVFRVTLANGTTVMHMGDADPNDDHYLPHKSHWQKQVTDTAFPPYWFFYSAEGRDILTDIINAKQHIGVHVPVEIPKRLIESKKLFFSTPGQEVQLHQH